MTTTTIDASAIPHKARATSSSNGPDNLTGVLDTLRRKTEGSERVDVEQVMDAFGGRLVGPLLIIPALLLISPIGAVPFLPAVLAIFILLVAAQHVVRRDRPWIPKWLARCSVERQKLVDAMDWLKPITKWVDKLIRPRLAVLVLGPMEIALAAAACVMALLVFPLAPVPFAVQLPAWGLIAIGLAMIARDGALAAIGLSLALAAVGFTLWVLL